MVSTVGDARFRPAAGTRVSPRSWWRVRKKAARAARSWSAMVGKGGVVAAGAVMSLSWCCFVVRGVSSRVGGAFDALFA